MRRASGKQRASALAPEQRVSEDRGRHQGGDPEAGEHQRVAGEMSGAEHLVEELSRVTEQRADQAPVGCGVRREALGRRVQRRSEDDRRLAVERMRDRSGRLDPRQSMVGEGQRREVWGHDPERVRPRADVMAKSREGELGGACATTDRLGGLEDEDRRAVSCQLDGGRKPVGSAADDDRVDRRGHFSPYAAGVAATTSPLASTTPSSQFGLDPAALELLLVDRA